MKEVFVAGVSQAPVRRGIATSLRTLGGQAIRDAIAHADVGPPTALVVGNMLSGMLSSQRQLATLLADASGLAGVEVSTVDAACASGAAALRQGVLMLASGAHDVVVVAGVELMTHADKGTITQGLATASDWEKEGAHGETFLTLNATLTRLYLERYRLPWDALAPFSITAHANAATNENALLRSPITLAAYEDARIVVPPLRLFDVSPVCDGAAAVVLVSRAALTNPHAPRIRVVGSAVATDVMAMSERADPLALEGATESARRAYAQAGIAASDVDLFELHDAYSVMAALALEAAGFADRGHAPGLAREGRIGLGGDVPIATMGGLKARGHPVGATGVYQAVEAWLQLAGRAGENQVHGARLAMTQSFGGTAATVITHVLERSA